MSMVSVSRVACPPHAGHATVTQSDAAASGLLPLGASCSPRRSSGSRTGSWSSGTGTSPHEGQCTMGMGAPQNRCRDSNQSRSRKFT